MLLYSVVDCSGQRWVVATQLKKYCCDSQFDLLWIRWLVFLAHWRITSRAQNASDMDGKSIFPANHLMCVENFILLSNIMFGQVTLSKNSISTPSREMDLHFTLTSCCPVHNRINWILSVCYFKQLTDIHQFISLMYVTKWGIDDSRSSAFLWMWSCVLSAYECAPQHCVEGW